MEPGANFQPEQVIGQLGRNSVRYVLIGGLAAITHGSPLVTQDIDICYDRSRENLERLAKALGEIHAALRGADSGLGLPFRLDATTLRNGDTFTLETDLGWLDVIGTPTGTAGYDDLARTAVPVEIFGYRVLIASIDDLIRMKRAAGRPKDLIELEHLGALRDELAEQGR